MRVTLLILILLPTILWSQTFMPLRTELDTVLIELVANNQQLSLQYQLNTAQPITKKNLSLVQKLALIEADLITYYQLSALEEEGFYYTLDASLISSSGEVIAQQTATIQPSFQKKRKSDTPITADLTWLDATENLLEYGREYQLIVRTQLWGNITCTATRPTFAFKQQAPHYVAAGVGLSLLGASQLFYKERDNQYKEYKKIWRAGASSEAAEPFYETAKNRQNTAKILTYTGWGILGLDAIALVYRSVKIKKAQRLYDQYCNKPGMTWQVSPLIDPERSAAGATLVVRF